MTAITIAALDAAALDAKFLAEVAISEEPTAVNRVGAVRTTMSGLMAMLKAEAASAAAVAYGVIFSDTAAGLLATPPGKSFSVLSYDKTDLIVYGNSGGVAVELIRFRTKVFWDMFSTSDHSASGYAYSIVDAENNILFGIDNSGRLVCKMPVSNLEGDVQLPAELNDLITFSEYEKSSVLTPDSGYCKVWTDANNNILMAIDDTGRLVCKMPVSNLEGDIPLPAEVNELVALSAKEKNSALIPDSGYCKVWVDAENNILMAIDDTGRLVCKMPVSNLEGDIPLPVEVNDLIALSAKEKSSALLSESGYCKVWVDADNNVLLGIDNDGRVSFKPSDELISLITSGLPKNKAKETVLTDGYLFETVSDANGIMQINATNRMSGEQKRLTNSSSDNSGLSAFAGGGVSTLMYQRGGEARYVASPLFVEYGVNAKRRISCWGDSMTQSYGGTYTTYPAELAKLTGVPVFNGGIGAQISSSIAARQGGRKVLLTVKNNTIPASGSVEITAKSCTPVTRYSGPKMGTLAGVLGTLTRADSSDSAVNDLTFTRAAPGVAVNCPPNELFVMDIVGDDEIQVLWIGRNNIFESADNLADVESCVNFIKPLVKKFVIVSVCNGDGEGVGTIYYDGVKAVNDLLKAKYPDNFCDVRKAIVDSYDINNPQDVINHSADTTPSSLRFDNIHFKDAGYIIVAKTIFNFMKSKRWF